MKKIIISIVAAVALVLGVGAFKSAANAQVGPNGAESCSDIKYSTFGNYQTRVCMMVWWSEPVDGRVEINQVRIRATNPDAVKSSNGLFVEYARVLGPNYNVNWSRNDVGVDRNPDGSVRKIWNPAFTQPRGGTYETRVRVNWFDGTESDIALVFSPDGTVG